MADPRRVVIDAGVALRIVAEDRAVHPDVALLSPVLMRSLLNDQLYTEVRSGQRDEAEARRLNARFTRLKLRYLGDAVLRRRAWDLAMRAGMPSTHLAEYLALTQLQADALATEDPSLIAWADGVVTLAPVDSILA